MDILNTTLGDIEGCVSCSTWSQIETAASQGVCINNTFGEGSNVTGSGGVFFETFDDFAEYSKVAPWFLAIIFLVTYGIRWLMIAGFYIFRCCSGSGCCGNKIIDVINGFRTQEALFGVMMGLGGFAYGIYLMVIPGADIVALRNFTDTPNEVWSIFMLFALFMMVWGILSSARANNATTFDTHNSLKGLMHLLFASWWYKIAAQVLIPTEADQQMVGVIMIAVSGVAFLLFHNIEWWLYQEKRNAHKLMFAMLADEPSNPCFDPYVKHCYKKHPDSPYESQREQCQELAFARAILTVLFDAIFIVGVGLQIDEKAGHHTHLNTHFLQIENQQCAYYWPIIALVVLGFMLLLWGLLITLFGSNCRSRICTTIYSESLKMYREEYSSNCMDNTMSDCYHPQTQHYLIRKNLTMDWPIKGVGSSSTLQHRGPGHVLLEDKGF